MFVLVAVLVIAIVAFLALRRQPPVVTVVSVAREDLSATITSNGKVEPISATVARAEFPTFVDKVMATEGQAVRRGQVILTLDAADVRSQLAQARADLLSAQNDLRNARAGGPPDQVAQLNGDLQAAQVQVKNLESNEQALESLVAKQAATQDELAQNPGQPGQSSRKSSGAPGQKTGPGAARIGDCARRRLARQPGAGTGAIA